MTRQLHVSELSPKRTVRFTDVCMNRRPITQKLRGVLAIIDENYNIITNHDAVIVCNRYYDPSTSAVRGEAVYRLAPKFDYFESRLPKVRFGADRIFHEYRKNAEVQFLVVYENRLIFKWTDEKVPDLTLPEE